MSRPGTTARSRCCAAAALGLAVLGIAWTGGARASNDDDFFVGNRAAMTGGAVAATVDDGSAAYYNHAGLVGVTGSKVDVSAAVYSLRLYSVEEFFSIEDGPSADASVTEFVAIPTQVAYVRELGPGVVLGLGYFVPKAENALLSERASEGDAANGSAWALDTRVTRSSSWLVAALGLRVYERLRVGFGAFGVYDTAVDSVTFFGNVTEAGATAKAIELSTLRDASRLGLAAGAGMQLDLHGGLTLGLWARSPQIQVASNVADNVHLVDGMLDATGTPTLDAVTSRSTTQATRAGLASAGRYHLGLAYRLRHSALSLEGDLQPGIESTRTGVDRDLVVNLRAGGTHTIAPGILLGAGVFSDRSSTPAGGATRLDFYGATAGIEVRHTLRLAEDEIADDVTFRTVFALRYAYGSGRKATLVADPSADVADLLSNAEGRQRVHEIALHVGSAVQF